MLSIAQSPLIFAIQENFSNPTTSVFVYRYVQLSKKLKKYWITSSLKHNSSNTSTSFLLSQKDSIPDNILDVVTQIRFLLREFDRLIEKITFHSPKSTNLIILCFRNSALCHLAIANYLTQAQSVYSKRILQKKRFLNPEAPFSLPIDHKLVLQSYINNSLFSAGKFWFACAHITSKSECSQYDFSIEPQSMVFYKQAIECFLALGDFSLVARVLLYVANIFSSLPSKQLYLELAYQYAIKSHSLYTIFQSGQLLFESFLSEKRWSTAFSFLDSICLHFSRQKDVSRKKIQYFIVCHILLKQIFQIFSQTKTNLECIHQPFIDSLMTVFKLEKKYPLHKKLVQKITTQLDEIFYTKVFSSIFYDLVILEK